MITLPTQLANFMKGKDLAGLKPFALLYRNKWDSVNNKFALEDTPIDISALIAKPNTLSMTLDVNEVAQYNANNVTLTLEDTKNFFVEGTPNSYFPEGYQVYGSKVVLYYGLNTPINPYPTQVGYTVVGSPTITDGVATGFNSNSYLISSSNLAQQAETECYVRVKIGQSVVTHNVFFGFTGGDYPIRYSPSYKFSFYKKNAGGWTEGITQYAVGDIVDVKYIYKDGYLRLYTKLASADLWTQEMQLAVSSNPIYGNFYFGRNATAQTQYISGAIDLNHTYIKVNGEYWFNGAHFFWKNNSTPLFTGVIKELPAHKPDKYQVDLKLVSPLEMLKDIEAKDFSDKVTGETLQYVEDDSDGHKIYQTTGTGVGGFDAVYADGVKLFEGVDFETDQLNELNKVAIVTIINETYYTATITADYYCWKTDLTVEQIVAGLVALGGYTSANEDIRQVVWNTSVRNQPIDTDFFAGIGYYESAEHEYSFNWRNTYGGSWANTVSDSSCENTLPTNWDYNFSISVNNESFVGSTTHGVTIISIGDIYNSSTINNPDNVNIGAKGVNNGISVRIMHRRVGSIQVTVTRKVYIHQISGGTATLLYSYDANASGTTAISGALKITRRGNSVTVYKDGTQVATATISTSMNYLWQGHYSVGSGSNVKDFYAYNQSWDLYDSNLRLYAGNITRPCFISDICDMTAAGNAWGEISATLTGSANYFLNAYFSTDLITWTGPDSYNLNTVLARSERYLYYVLGVQSDPNNGFTITNPTTYYLATTILLQLVNLSGLTVLEALQDFALISGYEFGVDRQGVFFFRPRLSSTLPVYVLDHSELVKVDSVKKNLSDFFTKLTLTFSEVPLEFYANTGARPTPIDKYGVINKEIDKPDIVNYDNPELAQAIGPQLLEVYSALPNVIQATGKLNLALELGDIVNLKRNFNLIADPEGSDFSKYIRQQTYYRACKVTGMNYNFAKRQITYTLRDVTDSYPAPQPGDLYGFVYELPIRLGVK